MMSEVQVSTARRVVFTAMAVVTFWVSAFGACSLASQLPLDLYERFGPETANSVMAHYLWPYGGLVCGPLMALIPLAFLSLSRHHSPIKLREHGILVGGLLFACCIGFCFWVGQSAYPARWLDGALRPLVLLPLLLTTAFVIYGARRRAVKSAAMAVVDEDDAE